MEYNYRIFYNDGSFDEKGTGNIISMERPIPPEVLSLVSTLEESNTNEPIKITVTTKEYSLSINSIVKL